MDGNYSLPTTVKAHHMRNRGNNSKEKSFRRAIFSVSSINYCYWCHCRLTSRKATADHVVPISAGGSMFSDNMVLSCVPCNRIRDDCMNLSGDSYCKLDKERINCIIKWILKYSSEDPMMTVKRKVKCLKKLRLRMDRISGRKHN